VRVRAGPGPLASESLGGTTNERDEAVDKAVRQSEAEWDEVEEMFSELGMEVIDECAADDKTCMLSSHFGVCTFLYWTCS
jgi:hypothetical protein